MSPNEKRAIRVNRAHDLDDKSGIADVKLFGAGKVMAMAEAEDLRRIALTLAGTVETPHFDRSSFRVRRIFVTLAADGLTANFMFTPDDQAFKCMLAPEAFHPVPNAWGARGATTAVLSRLNETELANALETAWRYALPKARDPGRSRR